MNKRQNSILKLIAVDGKVSVKELSRSMDVSSATVRQDLSLLENQGLLRRFHGGAMLNDTDDISHRIGVNYETKLKIARAAAVFVDNGQTVFVESGSINALLAKELSGKSDVTIVTPNAFIAQQVEKDSKVKVVLLGGVFQPESMSNVGNLARICLEHIHYSKAFIGIDGFTEDSGFTGRDMMRAEFNMEAIRRSPETFVLSDSTKFGTAALSRYCDTGDIEYLISDSNLDENYQSTFKRHGVEVILV
jgi:DeoR/GlpR family transcriptional regulator of sugar metabolism